VGWDDSVKRSYYAGGFCADLRAFGTCVQQTAYASEGYVRRRSYRVVDEPCTRASAASDFRAMQSCLTGTAAATVLTAGIAPTAKIAFTLGLLQTGVATGNTIGPLIGGVLADFLVIGSRFSVPVWCLSLPV
jgi:hypothetical protein